MPILLLPLKFAVLIFSALATGSMKSGQAEELRADSEIQKYRIFMQAADSFVKSQPAPASTQSYTWEQIKIAAGPGQRSAGMNSDWRIVWAPDGKWAACTEISEMGVAKINAMFASASVPASGASAPTSLVGSRILPDSIPGGAGGSLQLGNAGGRYTGLVGIGSPELAKSSAGLCNL